MGKPSSWDLNIIPSSEKCPCGSKKTKKSCCKTETKVVKLTNNYQSSAVYYTFNCPEKELYTPQVSTLISLYQPQNQLTYLAPKLPPPFLGSVSIFIKNCVFRI